MSAGNKKPESHAITFEQVFVEELERNIKNKSDSAPSLDLDTLEKLIKDRDKYKLLSFLYRATVESNNKLLEETKLPETLSKIAEINIKDLDNNKTDVKNREKQKEQNSIYLNETYKKALFSKAHSQKLVGLAFSGGGIRSATFNLGVLQGMAELGILRIFDYLSTVSGGGYIGSWLVAWIKKEGKKGNGDNKGNGKNSNTTGLDAVIEKLKPDRANHNKEEPDEIHRLRDYSNYLTPQKGLLGADTWLLLTTYLRNTFFNLLILVSVLFFIITLIQALLIFLYHPCSPLDNYKEIFCLWAPPGFIAVCIILRIVIFIRWPKWRWLTFVCCWLLIGAALSLSYGLWKGCYLYPKYYLVWLSITFFLLGLILSLFPKNKESKPFINFVFYLFKICKDSWKNNKNVFRRFFVGLIASFIACLLVFFLSCWIQNKKITAVSDFREDEFIDLSKVEALCKTLREDGIINAKEISFKAHENTIAHFNEILEIPQLYNNFINKYKNFKASSEIECIIEEIQNYRNLIMLWGIDDQKEDTILQNWFLLKVIYPKMFPNIQILYVRISMLKSLPKSNNESLIQWLNRLIRSPVFYDRNPQSDFSNKINYLVAKTIDARKKIFFSMDEEDRNNVKKLNRLLIEEMFPDDCPKSRHDKTGRLVFACFGMPTVILIFLFAGALWFLLSGENTFSEGARKRLGHFAVSLLGWTALTTALFAVTIFGEIISGAIVVGYKYFATFAWVNIMIVISGLLQRFIPGIERISTKWGFKMAIALGMCLIIGGAIIIATWLPHAFQLDQMVSYKTLSMAIGIPLAIAFLMACFMNINSLSLHTLYKDRLRRAYLGAHKNKDKSSTNSNEDTYDSAINEILTNNYDGPYPIINATLNLTKGAELAWQQRKAASFVFTPLHYGYTPDHRHLFEEDGKKLEKDAYRSWDGAEKFKLSDAMAISGAAASPSMGYRSSGALAFIMTVFNVRLGQWFNNPRHKEMEANAQGCWNSVKKWLLSVKESFGHFLQKLLSDKELFWKGLWYLLKELFGWSDEHSEYVYLSDGGHFENLGIYELVRRRCQYIVACDVGEDPDMEFGDLANAIEKCRTDFGIPIDIKVDQMKKNEESGNSGSHYAIGTIEYKRVDDSACNGTLVYIKASLTGDESLEIKSYKTQNNTFPHQTTLNQMFDESQFEAYRTLGIHVIKNVFGRVSHEIRDSNNVEKFFRDLSWIY